MKVIFLDVDGVINGVWPMPRKGIDPDRDELEFKIFKEENYRILSWPNYKAVDLLNRLIKETKAKVVISSAWRSRTDIKQTRLQKTFKECGLECEIIGMTPELNGLNRGTEIKIWLDDNVDVESYVIIDDENHMLESQQDNFVKTEFYDGFDFANYRRASKILGHEGAH